MTYEEAVRKMDALEATLYALRHAQSVLYIDAYTAAPKQSYIGRGRTIGWLSERQYRAFVTEENAEVFSTILACPDADRKARRRAEILKEDLDDMTRVPMDEYIAYQQLLNEAGTVWHEAKEKSDYPMFAPYLEKLIAFNRSLAQRKDPSRAPYDVLLDNYEKGTSMAQLDPFFATLRERLTPVIREIAAKPAPRTDFLTAYYPPEKQREFSKRLMALQGLDPERCTIGETEHPFTDGVNKWDVRVTTHYFDRDVASSMYSVIHEDGHALYEMGVDDELQFTCLAGGATMGLHESQSRFYENIIGRSLPFCRAVLPVLREIFPEQMRGVDAETLYRGINRAEPSLIRTEADELTYPLHVAVRYEMEKRMIAGEVGVKELPEMWNSLYREYLGVEVPDDRRGILQDSHWSGGSFGYFPSYALGSAYGAQMLQAMEKDVDVWAAVEAGNLKPVTEWLGARIHRWGNLLKPAELLRNAGVDPFRPEVYTDYLVKKFSDLYGL